MKKLNLVMIIIWCVIGLLILGVMAVGIFLNWGIGRNAFSFAYSDKSNSTLVVDENIPMKDINELNLSFAADSCRVFLTDGDSMNVKHYVRGIPKERYAQISRGDGEVTVTTKPEISISLFGITINSYSLVEIYMPKDYKDALNIIMTSGTVDIDGALDLSRLDVGVNSGTVRCGSEIKARETGISVTSGTIKLEGGLASENYSLITNSGTVNVDSHLTGSGDISVTSGTIRLNGVDITESLEVGVNSGTINIELAGDPSLKFTGKKNSGTIRTYFDTFSSDNGNRVFASVGDEPYKTLDVRVTSGTIRVNSVGGTQKKVLNPFDAAA